MITMHPSFLPAPLDQEQEDESEIAHYSCCDPNRAICGKDLTDYALVPEEGDDDTCVVCLDLREAPCSVTCPLVVFS